MLFYVIDLRLFSAFYISKEQLPVAKLLMIQSQSAITYSYCYVQIMLNKNLDA